MTWRTGQWHHFLKFTKTMQSSTLLIWMTCFKKMLNDKMRYQRTLHAGNQTLQMCTHVCLKLQKHVWRLKLYLFDALGCQKWPDWWFLVKIIFPKRKRKKNIFSKVQQTSKGLIIWFWIIMLQHKAHLYSTSAKSPYRFHNFSKILRNLSLSVNHC